MRADCSVHRGIARPRYPAVLTRLSSQPGAYGKVVGAIGGSGSQDNVISLAGRAALK
ncbi:hypothetical protein [Bradyrhizobium sp. USDA 3240]